MKFEIRSKDLDKVYEATMQFVQILEEEYPKAKEEKLKKLENVKVFKPALKSKMMNAVPDEIVAIAIKQDDVVIFQDSTYIPKIMVRFVRKKLENNLKKAIEKLSGLDDVEVKLIG